MLGAAALSLGWLIACARRDSIAETIIACALILYGAHLMEMRRDKL